MLNDTFSRFRFISFIEGISFLILVFIAMPLKYLAGIPLAVKIVGMAHGVLFILFFIALIMVANKYNLKVQPIVLFNTRNIVDSKSLKASPGIVKVVFLDPIQADKTTDWFEQTEENMKETFNKEYKNYVS